MIISDKTVRTIITDNKNECLEIVRKSLLEYFINIDKQGNEYVITLTHKAIR